MGKNKGLLIKKPFMSDKINRLSILLRWLNLILEAKLYNKEKR